MPKRRPQTKRPFLLFVRPARPGPGWPRLPVGDPKWAGVTRDGSGWFHDLTGEPMTKIELKWARFAVSNSMRWAVFRVVKVPK